MTFTRTRWRSRALPTPTWCKCKAISSSALQPSWRFHSPPLDNPQHATVLNPKLEVAGQAFVLETLAIGSFEPGELRSPLTNLGQDAQAIWDALDYAMHGC